MLNDMYVKELVGCGGKIIIFTLPFIIIGLYFNIIYPEFFRVYGYSTLLVVISALICVFGSVLWIWATVLIIIKVPKKELVTYGPYLIMKHPIYTGITLLIFPWAGFMFNSWLGVFIGLISYIISRIFRGEEETYLKSLFGNLWNDYQKKVWIKRL